MLPLYFATSHAFVLKIFSIVNFGNLEVFIYWLLFEGFIKSSAGGLLSAYNMYIAKIIYFFQAMAVYLHILACFFIAYYRGDQIEKSADNNFRLAKWLYYPKTYTYWHYFEFGMNSVLNCGQFTVLDGSSGVYGIMIPVTLISSAFFVSSVLLLCGLIMALNTVESLTQEQNEDIYNWFYKICTSSGQTFSPEFEKKLFRYFDFVQGVSVTDILEQHFFFRSLTAPLQESLKTACVTTLAKVFKTAKEDFSEEFLSKLILLCKPMA